MRVLAPLFRLRGPAAIGSLADATLATYEALLDRETDRFRTGLPEMSGP
jgi:hypothetical protein